jgi:dynein heavy chain
MNAEDIEQELGDMFRTMFKLTKVFSDQPGPRNVSDRLRVKIEKFRQHQPLLSVICNPGIRDRHWDQVMLSLECLCCYQLVRN